MGKEKNRKGKHGTLSERCLSGRSPVRCPGWRGYIQSNSGIGVCNEGRGCGEELKSSNQSETGKKNSREIIK